MPDQPSAVNAKAEESPAPVPEEDGLFLLGLQPGKLAIGAGLLTAAGLVFGFRRARLMDDTGMAEGAQRHAIAEGRVFESIIAKRRTLGVRLGVKALVIATAISCGSFTLGAAAVKHYYNITDLADFRARMEVHMAWQKGGLASVVGPAAQSFRTQALYVSEGYIKPVLQGSVIPFCASAGQGIRAALGVKGGPMGSDEMDKESEEAFFQAFGTATSGGAAPQSGGMSVNLVNSTDGGTTTAVECVNDHRVVAQMGTTSLVDVSSGGGGGDEGTAAA